MEASPDAKSDPPLITIKKNDEINNILNKDVFLGEMKSKHAEFLIKKITIETN